MSDLRAALGRSVLFEELKGDYAAAADLAARALATAERAGDPSAVTDARLDLALVRILQGLPAAAFLLLDSPDAGWTPDRRVRHAALRKLAVHECYNTFPGGEGAGGAHLAVLWDGASYAVEEHATWAEVPVAEASRQVGLEALLLHDALCNLKSTRTFVVPAPWVTAEKHEGYLKAAMQVPAALMRLRGGARSDPVVAYAYFVAADLCRRAVRLELAQSFLAEARGRYEELDDSAGVGLCWMQLGDTLAAPFTTPPYSNLPVEDVRDISSAISDELDELATAAPGPDVDAARMAYDQARACFERAGARRGLGSIDLREAYLFDLAKDSETAVALAGRAAECFASVGDQRHAHLARIHGIAYRIRRHAYEWIPEVARGVGAWGRAGGSPSWALGLGLFLTAWGRHWLQEGGEVDRAIACYRHAQQLYESLGAEVNVAQALVDRAEAHRTIGETAAAISLMSQALGDYERLSTHGALRDDLEGRTIRLLDSLFWLYAAEVDAEGMERSASALSAKVRSHAEDEPSDGTAVDRESAVSNIVLEQAHSTLESATVMVPLYRGKSWAEQGELEEARPHFDTALRAATSLEGAERAWLEAVVRGTMGDSDGAARVYEARFEGRSVPVPDVVAKALSTIARTAPETAESMRRRLDLKAHLNALYFLVQMDAFEAARRHLAIIEREMGPDWWRSEARPWEALVRRAELHAGLTDDDTALEDVDRCVALLDEARVGLPGDTQRAALAGSLLAKQVYALGIACSHRLLETHADERLRWIDRMYRYAEQGKGRALLDLLAAATTEITPHAASDVRRWREINARLSTWHALIGEEHERPTPREERLQRLRGRLEEDQAELQAFVDSIETDRPQFYSMIRAHGEVSPLTEVIELLPRDCLLLQYHFVDHDFFVWAMDGTGRADARRATHDARRLARGIRDFHAACSGGGDWRASGKRLSEVFLAPFGEWLDAFENVVVVPFSHAHRLPFHALPWGPGTLADEHAITFLPSGSSARYLRRGAGMAKGPVLAIGNPTNMIHPTVALDGERRALDALPFAELEARYVASLHGGSQALVRDRATADEVRPAMPRYRFLHFATHGVLNDRAPLSSAILLAHGEALTAADLLGMDLDADLVVLSGCRTGLGDLTAGDEVMGLTRALIASGARSAVVSLWPVRDAATSYLMRHFYEGLPQRGPAAALQEAQIFLRDLTTEQREAERRRLTDFAADEASLDLSAMEDASRDLPAASAAPDVGLSHPYFWAPFIHVGSPGYGRSPKI